MTVVSAAIPDITSDVPEVALGQGWYPLESFAGARFRWATNDTEILVAALQPVRHRLLLTIEPGPGVDLKPFTLKILDSGKEIGTFDVRGKETIGIPLPPMGPKVYRLVLHVDGGGKKIANEERILNFRVFDIAIERDPRDVLPVEMVFGRGWYPLEHAGTAVYRWVSNDAQVTVSNADGRTRLELDVESGPGLQNKPFVLHVLQNVSGELKPLPDMQVKERQRIQIPVPQGEKVELVLRVDATTRRTPGDPRQLNFRVFA